MAKKKPVTHELDAQELGLLTRKVNQCCDRQILADEHGGKASALKKEIRATLEAGGLKLHQTPAAFARIDEKESRKFDGDAVEAIRKMVDPADFEKVCPRKVDLTAFDEVVGHHRYPKLEGVPKVGTSTSLTVCQLAG